MAHGSRPMTDRGRLRRFIRNYGSTGSRSEHATNGLTFSPFGKLANMEHCAIERIMSGRSDSNSVLTILAICVGLALQVENFVLHILSCLSCTPRHLVLEGFLAERPKTHPDDSLASCREGVHQLKAPCGIKRPHLDRLEFVPSL